MPDSVRNLTRNLAAYVKRTSRFSVGSEPRTVQAYVARQAALSRQNLENPPAERVGSRIMWRLTWLELRAVLLIPSRLGEESVADLCETYMTDLRAYARARHADPEPLTLRKGILSMAMEIDSRHWSLISDRIERLKLPPLAWLDRDMEELLWIRFCSLSAIAAWTLEGRERSRREVAEIMAAAGIGPESATTIRLNLLPEVDQALQSADRWAAGLSPVGRQRLGR
jgi:hypothetical protein